MFTDHASSIAGEYPGPIACAAGLARPEDDELEAPFNKVRLAVRHGSTTPVEVHLVKEQVKTTVRSFLTPADFR